MITFLFTIIKTVKLLSRNIYTDLFVSFETVKTFRSKLDLSFKIDNSLFIISKMVKLLGQILHFIIYQIFFFRII